MGHHQSRGGGYFHLMCWAFSFSAHTVASPLTEISKVVAASQDRQLPYGHSVAPVMSPALLQPGCQIINVLVAASNPSPSRVRRRITALASPHSWSKPVWRINSTVLLTAACAPVFKSSNWAAPINRIRLAFTCTKRASCHERCQHLFELAAIAKGWL